LKFQNKRYPGGSALIKYVNEDVTFDYLRDNYTEECAVYCGGGNVLIIAPGGAEKRYARLLKKIYKNYSYGTECL